VVPESRVGFDPVEHSVVSEDVDAAAELA
jgi:hypothetical protein